MLTGLRETLREPVPLRFLIMRWLDRRFGLFSYLTGLELGSADRAWYGYPLLHSAWVARKLGYIAYLRDRIWCRRGQWTCVS